MDEGSACFEPQFGSLNHRGLTRRNTSAQARLDAYEVEADISQSTVSAETVENDPKRTFDTRARIDTFLNEIISSREDIFPHKLSMVFTMSRFSTIYFGLLGVAATIAIAWPPAVLIGLLLGFVPGILLWVAPSLLMYSLLWWITRAIIRRTPILAKAGLLRFVVPALSATIVAVPAVLIPHRINMQAEDAAQRLRTNDFEPDKPIVLPDTTVALVIDGNYNWLKRKPSCETLCVRLLFNSAVARVIAVDPAHGNSTTAFWIERRETCPDRPNLNFDVRWTTDFPLVRGDMFEDRVRTRIARGECLIEADGHLDEAAATISYRHVQKGTPLFQRPWSFQPGPPVVNRLEISGADGAMIYRRTEVTIIDLATPLQIETAAGFLTTVTYAGWGRYEKTFGQIGPHGRDVLPQILGDAARKPEKSSI